MQQNIQYYSDLLNDDFAQTSIKPQPLPRTFKYVRKNFLWRIWANFVYYIIAKPFFLIASKIKYHHRFANKKVIKQSKKSGLFIYANHTMVSGDAFTPNIVFPFKRNYVVVSKEAMSIFGTRILLQQLGVIPLSDKLSHKKQIIKTMEYRLKEKASITIYPEAHIWPYYNKIRPFDNSSFKYPVLFNTPVYAMTNCYQKRKHSNKPKVTTYFDGPFYPKENLSKQENALYLRDEIYKAMNDRATTYSTYEFIQYVYQPKEKDTI